jgi:hypothetical protein
VSLVDEHWERCVPYLQAALDRSIGGYALEHVRAMIDHGEAQLWPTDNSAGVSSLNRYPTGLKTIDLWLAGGDLRELKSSEQIATRWARETGCRKAVIFGRKGFLRELPGYREVGRILVKDLD